MPANPAVRQRFERIDGLLDEIAQATTGVDQRIAARNAQVRALIDQRLAEYPALVDFEGAALDATTAPEPRSLHRAGYHATIVCVGPRGKQYRPLRTAAYRTPEQAAKAGVAQAARLVLVPQSITVRAA